MSRDSPSFSLVRQSIRHCCRRRQRKVPCFPMITTATGQQSREDNFTCLTQSQKIVCIFFVYLLRIRPTCPATLAQQPPRAPMLQDHFDCLTQATEARTAFSGIASPILFLPQVSGCYVHGPAIALITALFAHPETTARRTPSTSPCSVGIPDDSASCSAQVNTATNIAHAAHVACHGGSCLAPKQNSANQEEPRLMDQPVGGRPLAGGATGSVSATQAELRGLVRRLTGTATADEAAPPNSTKETQPTSSHVQPNAALSS